MHWLLLIKDYELSVIVDKGGQNDDLLPSTSISTFNPTGRRHSLPFKKKVGSRGKCLLPLTFGKIEVEGTMFLYIESVKVPPSTSRLTKIDVAGSIFENYRPFTLVHNFAFSRGFLLADP
jgi:hypothetical protein